MRVQINPRKSRPGAPLQVRDPRTGRLFPALPFELDEAALADPRILRLLPPPPEGVPGGHSADLVPAPAGAPRPKDAAK